MMKKHIILCLIQVCTVQVLIAQQNTSPVMNMLFKHIWTKSSEQLGIISLKFKADSTYTVAGTLNFVLKEDDCEGRNMITPGTWKALK